MNSVLEALYHGDIAPYKATRSPTSDVTQQDEFMYYTHRLKQLLQSEIPQLETKYSLTLSELSRVYLTHTEEMFYQGFTLATKLLTEALSNT